MTSAAPAASRNNNSTTSLREADMSKLIGWIILVTTISLSACAPFPPHRPGTGTVAASCADVFKTARGLQREREASLNSPGSGKAPGIDHLYAINQACWQSSHEYTPDYDLYLIEFDDHGWLPGAAGGPQQSKIKWLMQQLNALVDKEDAAPLNLIVYTHGWHHSAAANDDNVNAFRDLLERANWVEQQLQASRPADVERAPRTAGVTVAGPVKRRVVGVYIGWRGDSLAIPGLETMSILDRKLAAEEVAQGAVQELFASLHNFYMAHACHFSEATERPAMDKKRCPDGAHTRTDVQMLTIGHSFGALITYRALAGRLIANITERSAPGGGPGPSYAHSFGDLVVLINPAFEAVHFEALARAASERSYRTAATAGDTGRAQLPALIVLQSEGDTATRTLFPLFRRFTTLFSSSREPAESETSLHGVGWSERYVTHRLSLADQFVPVCEADKQHRCLGIRIDIERQWREAQRARKHRALGEPHLVLSNGLLLDQLSAPQQGGLNRPPFMPVWVVRADKQISKNHNDFLNAHLIDFLRQMYYTVLEE